MSLIDFRVLTINIGNPSIERAIRQIQWIEEREEDIFVLTETKNSKGCNYIENYFNEFGQNLFTLGSDVTYDVYFPKSLTGDLGVMIISKYPLGNKYSPFDESNIFYSRFAGCTVSINHQNIRLMGLYVPSRDRSEEKVKRKKKFCVDFVNHLKSFDNEDIIISGDLNVLERNHIPKYSTFYKWEYDFYDFFDKNGYPDAFRKCHPDKLEYSWVGRTNDGYRYDHSFVSNTLKNKIYECEYIHETRELKLTDHSAMVLTLKL